MEKAIFLSLGRTCGYVSDAVT